MWRGVGGAPYWAGRRAGSGVGPGMAGGGAFFSPPPVRRNPPRVRRRRQQRRDALPQQGDQRRVHEPVVVRDAEADERLAGERVGELRAQPRGVPALHDEDHVGPAEEAGGHADAGTGLRAGGARLVAVHAVKEGFGRGAAPAVAAAEEEELQGTGSFSRFTSTFEFLPLASYFWRRSGGRSSAPPSAKPPLDWK